MAFLYSALASLHFPWACKAVASNARTKATREEFFIPDASK